MSDVPDGWQGTRVRDVVSRHWCGPSPDCEEREVRGDAEWGVLKTTAITWAGWDEAQHKVLPPAYWGQRDLAVRQGDVLVTKAGPRHRVGVTAHVTTEPKRLITSGKMIGLRPDVERVLPAILAKALALPSPQKFLDDRTTGMAESQVNFANTALLDTPLVLPPLPEQRAIAAVLDTLDDAIQKTEQIIAKLKQVKQGLLHDLLTRGIDDNGELRDPERHPEQFQDSPLGRIPKGWEVLGLTDIAANHDGRRIPLKQGDRERRRGQYPYYGASGVIDTIDAFIFDGDFVLLGEDGENVVSRHLPLAFRATGKIWVNNHAHVYEPLPRTDIRFLVELLEATSFAGLVSGSAQPKLTQEALGRLRFAVPNVLEQRALGDLFEAHAQRAEVESRSLAKLRAMKSGIAEDLLTGRVRTTSLTEAAT